MPGFRHGLLKKFIRKAEQRTTAIEQRFMLSTVNCHLSTIQRHGLLKKFLLLIRYGKIAVGQLRRRKRSGDVFPFE